VRIVQQRYENATSHFLDAITGYTDLCLDYMGNVRACDLVCPVEEMMARGFVSFSPCHVNMSSRPPHNFTMIGLL
jgi:hypothetical protein